MSLAFLALLGAIVTVTGCYAAGAGIIAGLGVKLLRGEQLPLAFVLGASCLHLAIFGLLALKIAYWPVVLAMVLVGQTIVFCRLPRHGSPKATDDKNRSSVPRVFCGILPFLPFAMLAFFHAWAPESSADGSGYHLGTVARYFRAHGFEHITNNMYYSLSGGLETLFLPAFMIGRHSAAALVHFTFLVALALAMFAYGRRLGKPWAGAVAAFLTFASPVVAVDGSSAYNDVAVAAVAFAAFYWLEIWDESRANRLLIPVGLLAGYAYAVKYTAFVMLLFALGFVLWRSRSARSALLVAACAIPMVAPWMIKNWVYVQNPIAPLGNAVFRNPNVHVSFEQAYGESLRRYGLPDKRSLPLDATVHGAYTGGVLGPVFLAAPLALLSLRQRAGRRLLAAGALLFATYFFNIGTRFLIPCLPFVSLGMALTLEFSPPLLAIVMLFHGLTSWPAGMRVYAGPSVWALDRIRFKQTLRIASQDDTLRHASENYALARLVEAHVPKGERVLAMKDVAFSYTSREVVVGFESGFGEVLRDIVNTGWNEDQQPSLVHDFRFAPIAARGVRLAVSAPSHDQWGVHELRFYSQDTELPRGPQWRLQAWPNPWDVQLAFDNSGATRWRTWESAKPGMYLEADFATPQMVDEVISNSSNDNDIQAIVQVLNDQGTWRPIAAQVSVKSVRIRSNLRQAAVYELHVRGVNYLLMRDTDYGAEDIRDDPESWGLKEIAAQSGARLYEVIL